MKKAIWIKIIACLIAAIPPVIVLIYNYPIMVSRPDKAISMVALVVGVILLLIFKDGVKKFLKTPGYLKFSIIILIISLLASTLGDQLTLISMTATISGVCALPLNIWYDYLTKPVSTNDILDIMRNIGKENNNEQKSVEKTKTDIN